MLNKDAYPILRIRIVVDRHGKRVSVDRLYARHYLPDRDMAKAYADSNKRVPRSAIERITHESFVNPITVKVPSGMNAARSVLMSDLEAKEKESYVYEDGSMVIAEKFMTLRRPHVEEQDFIERALDTLNDGLLAYLSKAAETVEKDIEHATRRLADLNDFIGTTVRTKH